MTKEIFDPNSLFNQEEEKVVQEEEEKEEEVFDPNSLFTQDEKEEEVFDPNSLFISEEPVEDVQTERPAPSPVPDLGESPAYKLDVTKSFEEFATDQGYIDSIVEYAESRYGKEKVDEQLAGKSNEEILELFLSEVRAFETNSINLTGTIDYVRGASEEEKQNFGFIYSQLERMPGFLSEGGGSALRGIKDYVGYFVSDPLNLIGFGAGKVAASGAKIAILEAFKTQGKKEAIKQATKLSLQAAKKPLAVEMSVDLGTGTMEELGRQTIKEEVNLREDVSVGEALLIGGIQSVAGGVLTTGSTAAFARDTAKDIITEARLTRINITKAERKKAAEILAKKETETIAKDAEEGYVYDPINGSKLLEAIDVKDKTVGGAKLTEPQLQVELTKRLTQIATDVVAEMAQGGRQLPKALEDTIRSEKKASEVARIVLASDDIDTAVLDAAVKRAGISMEDFLDISGVTTTDAAKTMRAYSDLGKILKRIRELEPKKAKEIEKIFGPDLEKSAVSKVHDFMMKLDRERRAFMVSQIATTARNVATAGMRLTMEGTARTMESSLYHLGKGLSSLSRGEVSASGTVRGVKQVLYDGFGTLQYLTNHGASKDLTNALLANTPRLHRIMNRTLQEVDVEQSLSIFARGANILNMAQDAYFRSAVFNDSVERQLRAVGIDIIDFVQSGKQLPTSVAQRAVDDALSFTFARMPRFTGKGVGKGEKAGHLFVKANELMGPLPGVLGIPIGTGAFPFARFMVNAMQFQFDYSPISTIGAIRHSSKGLYKKYVKGASQAETEADFRKFREQISKAAVGTAALYAAVKVRGENQDLNWYDMRLDDGRTIDTRPFFPIAPYLIVADFIVKYKNKELDETSFKSVLEGLTGAQLRAGASSYMVDSFFQNLSNIGVVGEDGSIKLDIKAEKLTEYMSGYLGELVGGFTTPLKVVSDIEAQFSKEEALLKDARQVEGTTTGERAMDTFTKTATRGLPSFLRPDLPVKESPTQEAPIVRQSPLLGQLTGYRPVARRSDAQTELVSLGIKNYEVLPDVGDREATAAVAEHMGKLFEKHVAYEITLPSYTKRTTTEKKVAMRKKLARFRKTAKDIAKSDARIKSVKEGLGYTPFDRAAWAKASGAVRKLADDFYLTKYGKTVMEMQQLEPNKNHFEIGKIIGTQMKNILQ